MVYLHVPFCRSFCTYCDFYSELACKGRDDGRIEAYAEYLCAEIAARREEMEAASAVNTLYIGGGTPSVLPLSVLERIVTALDGGPLPRSRKYGEFTVEVNPEDIVEKGEAYVRGLVSLGVNRISMGVQSLDDGILRWMNRRHDSSGAVEAFRILRRAGVENISLDLIFGISHLSDEALLDTLDRMVEMSPEHVSAYQLGIEEGSALAEMVADGRYSESGDTQCALQYEMICRRLHEEGYVHYEISNWARPGFEARHNSAYWERVPYVGLGPGAHSFDGSRRCWNSTELSGWSSSCELLSPEEAREEEIMLGLRTAKGIPSSLCDPAVLAELLSEGSLEPAPDPAVLAELLSEGSPASVPGPAVPAELSSEGSPEPVPEPACRESDSAPGVAGREGCAAPDTACRKGCAVPDRVRIPEARFFVSDAIIERIA